MKPILLNACVCGCLVLAGCNKSDPTESSTSLTANLMMTQAANSLPQAVVKPARTTPEPTTDEPTASFEESVDAAIAEVDALALKFADELELPQPTPSSRKVRVPTDQEVQILFEGFQKYLPNDSTKPQSLANGQN